MTLDQLQNLASFVIGASLTGLYYEVVFFRQINRILREYFPLKKHEKKKANPDSRG